MARGVGAGRVAALFDVAGKLLLVTALAAPIVDVLQGHYEEAAVSAVGAGLAAVGAFVPGPIGWAALTIGAVITIVSVAGSQASGAPPRRIVPREDNPGHHNYPIYVDHAGVPRAHPMHDTP